MKKLIFNPKPMKNFRCQMKKGPAIPNPFFFGILVISVLCTSGIGVKVGKTSVKIGKKADVSIKGGFSVSADALFLNNNSVYFRNDRKETLDINTLLGGEGIYHLKGADGYTLTGAGAAITSLGIESGHTLLLEKNLSVLNKLYLDKGIVEVSKGSELKVQSDDPKAIVFEDRPDNKNFINGTLAWNVLSGQEYTFPLGAATEGFHPFKLGKASSSGYIGVSYEPGLETRLKLLAGNLEFEDTGGWQVKTSNSSIVFIPSLSLYNNNTQSGVLYNVFYSPNIEGNSPNFQTDYNSVFDQAGVYLTTKKGYGSGWFAINKVEMVENQEKQYIPKLVNMLIQDGNGRTTFEIPGIFQYRKVTMSVYNRFGGLVYKSNSYANDFDSKDFIPGTYFYVLTLEPYSGKEILVRNIIEIIKHNK
jgi:hypothetical protein